MQGRQIEIVDIDATLHTVRTRSFLNFYSPEAQRRQVTASPDLDWTAELAVALKDFRITWPDRPEAGFRGMYSGGSDFGKPDYHFTTDFVEIADLPTQIWSTGSVVSEWECDELPGDQVESELAQTGSNRISGRLTHYLPGPITNWFLAYGSFAYFPRSSETPKTFPLEPGETFNVGEARSNILKGVLTGLTQSLIRRGRAQREDASMERQDYDPLSRDPFTIVQTLTFHQATGGSEYTTLSNDSLPELDLSRMLDLNRAVLFGQLSEPVTTFEIDGAQVPLERRETFVRIILPVTPHLRAGDTLPPEEFLKIERP